MIPVTIPSPIQEITEPFLEKKEIRLFLKREDLIHPVVSGNKWRKLKYNLQEAKAQNQTTLLSFGGAYSNHIHALSFAGKSFGFKTIGIIRGEKTLPLNPTLTYATEQGMLLHYLSREEYREKETASFLEKIKSVFGEVYIIPEGGKNNLAIKGCAEIPEEIEIDYDYLCTSCGTGTTMAGLIAGCHGKKSIIGFSALKGNFISSEVQILLNEFGNENTHKNWSVQNDYHFGGYAKTKKELLDFINGFETTHQLPLEPVYIGKMLFGIYDLIEKGFFKKGSRIIALHTGGLQGNEGMKTIPAL